MPSLDIYRYAPSIAILCTKRPNFNLAGLDTGTWRGKTATNISFALLQRLFGRALPSRQVNCLTCGPETGSHPHQVGKGIRLHFSHDLSAVCLYRDFADDQFCADLLV
jgi:hypothetical protein